MLQLSPFCSYIIVLYKKIAERNSFFVFCSGIITDNVNDNINFRLIRDINKQVQSYNITLFFHLSTLLWMAYDVHVAFNV